jgi:hypothetical protein
LIKIRLDDRRQTRRFGPARTRLHPGRRAAGSQRILDGTWCGRHRSPVRVGSRSPGLHSGVGAAHAATSNGTATSAERVVLADQPGKLRQRIGLTAAHRTTPAWIETIQIVREGPFLETISHRDDVSPFGLAANCIQSGSASCRMPASIAI